METALIALKIPTVTATLLIVKTALMVAHQLQDPADVPAKKALFGAKNWKIVNCVLRITTASQTLQPVLGVRITAHLLKGRVSALVRQVSIGFCHSVRIVRRTLTVCSTLPSVSSVLRAQPLLQDLRGAVV